MYFSLMLGRVMLTCDSFALVGWTSTPKGGFVPPADTAALFLSEFYECTCSFYHHSFSLRPHGSYMF